MFKVSKKIAMLKCLPCIDTWQPANQLNTIITHTHTFHVSQKLEKKQQQQQRQRNQICSQSIAMQQKYSFADVFWQKKIKNSSKSRKKLKYLKGQLFYK